MVCKGFSAVAVMVPSVPFLILPPSPTQVSENHLPKTCSSRFHFRVSSSDSRILTSTAAVHDDRDPQVPLSFSVSFPKVSLAKSVPRLVTRSSFLSTPGSFKRHNVSNQSDSASQPRNHMPPEFCVRPPACPSLPSHGAPLPSRRQLLTVVCPSPASHVTISRIRSNSLSFS